MSNAKYLALDTLDKNALIIDNPKNMIIKSAPLHNFKHCLYLIGVCSMRYLLGALVEALEEFHLHGLMTDSSQGRDLLIGGLKWVHIMCAINPNICVGY